MRILIMLLLTSGSVCAQVKIAGHRGGYYHQYPESSFPLFEFIASQFAGDTITIEIDVRTSKDKTLYLMHDETLERTTNGQGLLAELTASELDRLDAGSWFHPRFAEQRVPRLADFLRWIKGKAKVYLDVKAADLQALLALLAEVGMTEDVFFLE